MIILMCQELKGKNVRSLLLRDVLAEFFVDNTHQALETQNPCFKTLTVMSGEMIIIMQWSELSDGTLLFLLKKETPFLANVLTKIW